MNNREILRLYDESRKGLSSPGYEKISTRGVVRQMPEACGMGRIEFSDHSLSEIDSAIEREIEFFEKRKQDFEWKVFDHDRPYGLMERLASRGFEIGEREAFLVLNLKSVPEGLRISQAHNVKKVASHEELINYVSVHNKVFKKSPSTQAEGLLKTMKKRLTSECLYVGYFDDSPVACGRISFEQDGIFAGLWGGATLAEYRNRGLYTSILAERVKEAIKRNFKMITVDALPASRPILEKWGFSFLGFTCPCVWRSGTSIRDNIM